MIVFIEGIDKSGKDTIARYVNEYTNYAHYVSARGPMSVIAYSEKFGRDSDNFEYLKKIKDNILIVYLVVDEDDFNIRCKLTNEPFINYNDDCKLFDDAAKYCMSTLGLNVSKANTSKQTPQQIATLIVHTINALSWR